MHAFACTYPSPKNARHEHGVGLAVFSSGPCTLSSACSRGACMLHDHPRSSPRVDRLRALLWRVCGYGAREPKVPVAFKCKRATAAAVRSPAPLCAPVVNDPRPLFTVPACAMHRPACPNSPKLKEHRQHLQAYRCGARRRGLRRRQPVGGGPPRHAVMRVVRSRRAHAILNRPQMHISVLVGV